MQVSFIDEGEGWKGSSDGTGFITITEPVNLPAHQEWQGCDDVTTCTEGSAALEEMKNDNNLM